MTWSDPPTGRTRTQRLLRAIAGPALTLVVAAGVELLRPTPLRVPGPGVVLLLAVAWSAYVGGVVPGAISVLVTVGYATWFYGPPPGGFDPEDLRRLVDLSIGGAGLVAMLGILRARAERARRLEAEAAVEQQYRVVFEEAVDSVLLADPTGRFTFANRRACEMTGYAREELLRMRAGDLIDSGMGSDPNVGTRRLGGGPYLERELVRRDGRRLRVEMSMKHLPDGTTLRILRDVTGQREAVDHLRAALSTVQATLDSTSEAILVVDASGKWAGWNRRLLELWRIPAEIADAGDDARALAFVTDQLVDPQAFLRKVRELYATPDTESQDEIFCRDGRVIERQSVPQRVGERIVGRVWSFRDVTEARRQAEVLRETERRFIQAEKLEAVGRLAGGIAHDFNNMLTAILGEADLLLLQLPEDARARRQVESIHSAAMRSAQLTRQLLAFARRHHTEPRAFALTELVSGIEPLARRLVGASVDVQLDLPPGSQGPWVHADPSQLEQAVLNLVINAGDAMPDGGTLTLRVCRETVEPDELATRGARQAGTHGCVCVIDTGPGIPEHVRPHLFEPFFTTKPAGKGTGLGLASVHGIVEEAHGFVEVCDGTEHGAHFRVLVPECEPHAGAASPASPDVRGHDGTGRGAVLLVDDEPTVRTFVATVLAHAGFDVASAGGGEEALQLSRGRTEPFDLLLTDVVMPGMHGPELARRVLEDGRANRVLFMSGYPGQGAREELAELSPVSLIQKPFRADELLERVRSAIAATARHTR